MPVNFFYQVPSLSLSTGQTVTGQRTVAIYLSKMSKVTLLGNSPLERAQVDQWLEYTQCELGSHLKQGTLTKGALEVGRDQMEPGIWFPYPVVWIFTTISFSVRDYNSLYVRNRCTCRNLYTSAHWCMLFGNQTFLLNP